MNEKKVNKMIHTSLIHKEMLHSVKKQSREMKTSDKYQGSKFKFEFGSTCATRCKFLGAQLKILGAQLIM